jgi:hypothetical protein
VDLYIHSPIRLHGVVLNEVSADNFTLPYHYYVLVGYFRSRLTALCAFLQSFVCRYEKNLCEAGREEKEGTVSSKILYCLANLLPAL